VGDLGAEGTLVLVLALAHGFQKLRRVVLLGQLRLLHHSDYNNHLFLVVMAQNESSKRAASVLIIAQHKFKQALKKEDTDARSPPVSVELSAQFLSDLDAVLKQNTSVNVQVSDYKAIDHLSLGAD
jgi:hypothetical protein